VVALRQGDRNHRDHRQASWRGTDRALKAHTNGDCGCADDADRGQVRPWPGRAPRPHTSRSRKDIMNHSPVRDPFLDRGQARLLRSAGSVAASFLLVLGLAVALTVPAASAASASTAGATTPFTSYEAEAGTLGGGANA